MKFFLFVVGMLILLVIGPMWYGYILSVLWGYFIVSAFHLPQISFAEAIGIGLVVRMLTQANTTIQRNKDDDASEVLGKELALTFIYPLMVLVIGFIVHLFV